MYGNVLEWCGDWYAPNYNAKAPSADPQGPSEELRAGLLELVAFVVEPLRGEGGRYCDRDPIGLPFGDLAAFERGEEPGVKLAGEVAQAVLELSRLDTTGEELGLE